jgi:hypothetical protein
MTRGCARLKSGENLKYNRRERDPITPSLIEERIEEERDNDMGMIMAFENQHQR